MQVPHSDLAFGSQVIVQDGRDSLELFSKHVRGPRYAGGVFKRSRVYCSLCSGLRQFSDLCLSIGELRLEPRSGFVMLCDDCNMGCRSPICS